MPMATKHTGEFTRNNRIRNKNRINSLTIIFEIGVTWICQVAARSGRPRGWWVQLRLKSDALVKEPTIGNKTRQVYPSMEVCGVCATPCYMGHRLYRFSVLSWYKIIVNFSVLCKILCKSAVLRKVYPFSVEAGRRSWCGTSGVINAHCCVSKLQWRGRGSGYL